MTRYAERLYYEHFPNMILTVGKDLPKKKRIYLIDMMISIRGGEVTDEELESIEKRLTLEQRREDWYKC